MNHPVVSITFYDHVLASGGSKPLLCKVYGELVNEDKLSYYVASWVADEEVDGNSEVFTILRSTVTKKTILKRGKK